MPISRVFVQENPERLHHLKGIYTYRLNKDIDKKTSKETPENDEFVATS